MKFSNNYATSSGQSIENNDHVQMNNVAIVAYERVIAPHLCLSDGDISLSNITIKLLRDSQFSLPSKSLGVVIMSIYEEGIKLSKGMSFSCPKNFNVNGLKNMSIVKEQKALKVVGGKGAKKTIYKQFSVDCVACPSNSYTLHSGHMYIPEFSSMVPPDNKVTIQNNECLPCPTGNFCNI